LSTWHPEVLLALRDEAIQRHARDHPDEVPLGQDSRRSVVSNVVAFRGDFRSAFALDLSAPSPLGMPGVHLVPVPPPSPCSPTAHGRVRPRYGRRQSVTL